MFVQFSDATKTVIVSVFACQQDANDHPNQGQVDASDAQYLAFLAAQQAAQPK